MDLCSPLFRNLGAKQEIKGCRISEQGEGRRGERGRKEEGEKEREGAFSGCREPALRMQA